MTCKELCSKYEAKTNKNGRYQSGQRRCQVCQIFLDPNLIYKDFPDWNGVKCICCKLRTRGHTRVSKLRKRIEHKRYEA